MLEDNDILHLARGSYNIYNLQRDDPSAKVASVSRALSRLDMEVSTSLRHLLFILSFCQCILGLPQVLPVAPISTTTDASIYSVLHVADDPCFV